MRKRRQPVAPSPHAVLVIASLWAATAAAAPPAGPRVYVSNEDGNDVTVIDARSDEVVAKIPVGKRPRGLRLHPDGRRLLVALSGSPKAPPGADEAKLPPADRAADGVGVVDLAAGKVVRVLKSGQDPEAFDITRDGKTIIVSNEETSEASFVDLRSGRVTRTVPTGGEPEGVTLRPDNRFVYVTAEADNQVAVIDVGKRKRVAALEVGARPRTIVFSPDGALAFVTCENSAQVSVIDARRHAVKGDIKIETPAARPMGAALSPDGKTLYVSNGRGTSVSIIDVASSKVVGTINDVGVRPWGVGVSPDGTKLYTANGPSHDVSVIDLAARKVVKRVPSPGSPWGIAVSGR